MLSVDASEMVYSFLQKGWCIVVGFLCFSLICDVNANVTVEGTVFVDGRSPIAKTDKDFICATLDWWPPEKCDYGTCSWDHDSLLNLVCFLMRFLYDCPMFNRRTERGDREKLNFGMLSFGKFKFRSQGSDFPPLSVLVIFFISVCVSFDMTEFDG